MTSQPLPTLQDFDDEYRRHAPGLKVYHAGPEWLRIEYGGIDYWLPPDLGGEYVDHPVLTEKDGSPVQVKADGVLEVKALYGNHYNPRFGHFERKGEFTGHSALEIARFMQMTHGERGVVWIRDAKTDEDVKRNAERMNTAKKLHTQSIRTWATGEVQARQAFVRNWQQLPGNKGKRPPLPTPAQSKAQEIMDAAEEDQLQDGFACTICYGYASKDWASFNKHLQRQHKKMDATPEDYGSIGEDEAPVKRGPGRPRKVQP